MSVYILNLSGLRGNNLIDFGSITAMPMELHKATYLYLKEYCIKPGREGGIWDAKWVTKTEEEACSCPDGASVGILDGVWVCVYVCVCVDEE